MSKADILFISHGGGPLPLLGDPGHQQMVQHLRALASEVPHPRAILVISAHWEAQQAAVTSAARPGLIYDYSGFPPESYEIQYPAPGEPALAGAVLNALKDAGIEATDNAQRGFDHGVFVPLKIMYPDADIPCVQLSLVRGLDPETHLALGKALQALDYPGLLVIGSGFSFHNMRAFFSPESSEMRAANLAFQHWLEETLLSAQLSESERHERLLHWESAPAARYCHPREEHLLPLHVCYGMAERAADQHLETTILGKASGMYAWFGDRR